MDAAEGYRTDSLSRPPQLDTGDGAGSGPDGTRMTAACSSPLGDPTR